MNPGDEAIADMIDMMGAAPDPTAPWRALSAEERAYALGVLQLDWSVLDTIDPTSLHDYTAEMRALRAAIAALESIR